MVCSKLTLMNLTKDNGMFYLFFVTMLLNYFLFKLLITHLLYVKAPWTTMDHREQTNTIGSINDVELMKEIISRMYGCTIIQFQQNNVTLVKAAVINRTHCNLLPAILAIELESAFVIFYEQTTKYTLRE